MQAIAHLLYDAVDICNPSCAAAAPSALRFRSLPKSISSSVVPVESCAGVMADVHSRQIGKITSTAATSFRALPLPSCQRVFTDRVFTHRIVSLKRRQSSSPIYLMFHTGLHLSPGEPAAAIQLAWKFYRAFRYQRTCVGGNIVNASPTARRGRRRTAAHRRIAATAIASPW